jgi:PLP dependent protein
MSLIAANLQDMYAKIDTAIKGRPQAFLSPVTLIAVSKTKPLGDVLAAYAAGQRDFGENYVQEAVEKINAFTNSASADHHHVQWHLIGPLQSNKAKLVANHFDWVHTIDRAKIADALNTHRGDNAPPLNVLVQINISTETSKSGVSIEEAASLIKHVATLKKLRCRGLMAIVENSPDEVTLRAQFRQLRQLFDKLKNEYADLDTLSMGMSQDFALSIDEGATMVRIGSAIFGARTSP